MKFWALYVLISRDVCPKIIGISTRLLGLVIKLFNKNIFHLDLFKLSWLTVALSCLCKNWEPLYSNMLIYIDFIYFSDYHSLFPNLRIANSSKSSPSIDQILFCPYLVIKNLSISFVLKDWQGRIIMLTGKTRPRLNWEILLKMDHATRLTICPPSYW